MKNLTDRENDIMELMVQGKRNKDIAQELGIKVRTVKNHCTRIFLKLGVKNRTEAALKFLRLTK